MEVLYDTHQSYPLPCPHTLITFRRSLVYRFNGSDKILWSL